MNRDTLVMVRTTISEHWKPTSQKAGEAKHRLMQHIDAELSEPVLLGTLSPVQRLALARGQRTEQADGAQGEREALPHWEPCNPGCDPEFNGERSRYCAQLCHNARAALAQPSPAPELSNSCGPMPDIDLSQYNLADVEGLQRWAFAATDELTAFDSIVGALRAEIEGFKEANRRLSSDRNGRRSQIAQLTKERDAAQARVAELEKQEPVAIVSADYDKPVSDIIDTYLPPGTKLYAAPVAQAGQVPDRAEFLAWAEKVLNGEQERLSGEGYLMDANDCIAALREAAAPVAQAGQVPDGWSRSAASLLRKWEWNNAHFADSCPVCSAQQKQGHESGCALAMLLAAAPQPAAKGDSE